MDANQVTVSKYGFGERGTGFKLICPLLRISNGEYIVQHLVTLKLLPFPPRNMVCPHPSYLLRHLTVVSGKSRYFCFQVYSICNNASTISGNSNFVYEIWRTWDDCLWFQDLLENRYEMASLEKRQRLRAGKGVKKNGMYLHDRAASFESLPPGPDPRSVAKDIHQYLPKLTKRGTLFGANQATVDQRQKEICALFKAYFQDDVPMLIKELREDRAVRDFFGYWQRDHDLAARSSSRPKTAPADGISTRSFISSIFSTSTITLSHPHPGSPPISPRSASSHQRSFTTDSTLSLPDAGSVLSAASTPPSPPAHRDSTFRDSSATSEDGHYTSGQRSSSSSSSSYTSSTSSGSSRNRATSLQRAQSHSHGTRTPTSARSGTFNVSSDFPLFLSSSTRDMVPASRPPQSPHSPSYVNPGLETLQEDATLDSSVSYQPHCRRRDSPANSERANRSCVAWPDAEEVSSSEGDVYERELLTPVDGSDFGVAVAGRAYSEHEWPSSTGPNDSRIEIDLPEMTCADSYSQLEGSIPPPAASSSTLTLNRNRRRRSLSQPLPYNPSVPTDVGEGDWPDQAGDFIEAYIGGPEPLFAPDSIIHYDDVPSDFPLDICDDQDRLSIMTDFSTSRQEIPHFSAPQQRPRATAPSPSPQPPKAPKAHKRIAATPDTLFVKAAFDDAMVAFRAQRDVPLAELRERVRGKFSRTEDMSLCGEFELSYLPPAPPAGVGAGARFRASSLSLVSMTSIADWSGAVPLRSEEDWANAVASCGAKITIRVS